MSVPEQLCIGINAPAVPRTPTSVRDADTYRLPGLPDAALVERPGRRSWALARGGPILGILLCITVVVAGLLPPQLGGATSYVITRGVSMLPHFHAGDLVVLRQEPTYHVGEVAAYHNGQLGVVVMHRIYAVHGDRYAFKGDNNNFVDTYQPTQSQILGAEWIHLPAAGAWLDKLRAPAVAAALLAGLWLYTFSSRSTSRRHRRRRRHGR